MTKTIFKKVMFVGRATVFMVGLAVILALTVGVAGAAFGANGGNFILGQTNAATAITKLAGSTGVAGPSLQIDNNSTNAAATALDLQVEPGKAPMTVNSDAQVANLNADKLDGKSANEFVPKSFYVKDVSTIGQTTAEGTKVGQASCDSGDRVLTGGFLGMDEGTRLISSFPTNGLPVWQVEWKNDATADTIIIVAHCINQTP